MSALMFSIMGIRGILGESLTPQVISKYTLAFAEYLQGGMVVIGCHSCVSGPFVAQIIKGSLVASGCKVIDIGIAPTPITQFAIQYHKAAGGIVIMVSYNPIQWHGLKFMGSDGRFLNPEKIRKVYQLADRNEQALKASEGIGSEEIDDQANQRYIESVLKLSLIDVEAIKARKFKVVIDTLNGAGGFIIPQLCKSLGCEVITVNGNSKGMFAHKRKPLPENLRQLSEKVRRVKADVGFAVDPDTDRCSIVDDTGKPIGEEYTLAIAAKLVFSKKMGRMAVNMSTSRASEDIAKYYNCMFVRSKVGEINVAEKMLEFDAIIGGEGNGGVILPELHLGRNASVAVALTLQYLAEYGGTMQELHASLPQYTMVKKKINIEGAVPDKILEQMTDKYKDYEVNLLDGVKIDINNSWVHLSKSNTEPIVRIISEAPTVEEAKKLGQKFMAEIKSLI